ncbi:MAG: hypothetical protein ACK412_00490 [Chloroherpetonaceae bacterium]
MLKLTISLALLALFVTTPATAQDTKKEKKQTTLIGYLSDCMCGESLESVKMAADHPKECCLVEMCAKSGYGIYSNGKFIKFDPKGNEKAKAFLTTLKKEKDLKVKVKGKMENNVFILASIEDAK